jgi:predicted DNA-binding protein (UPF0251 family)
MATSAQTVEEIAEAVGVSHVTVNEVLSETAKLPDCTKPSALHQIETKRCRHCRRTLPTDAFYSRGDGQPASWCKECQKFSSSLSYHDPGKGLARAARLKAERAAMRAATKDQKLMPFHLIAKSIGVSPQQAWNIFNSGMRKIRQSVTEEQRSLFVESTRLRDARQTWGDLFEEESSS